MTASPRHWKPLLALLLLVPAPSLGTWLGMILFPNTPFGQVAFGVAKVWILLFPLLWCRFVERQKLAFPRWSNRGMAAACGTGLLFVLAIAGAYWFIGRDRIDVGEFRAVLSEVGFTTPAIFVGGALYWCTINSILEEYVWRWFAFCRSAELVPKSLAALVAGLLFTLHHVVALRAYFGWDLTLLASLGVWIGGATWSWIYQRYGNIWAAYVSHVFADVAIFTIGYLLLFG